MGGVGVTRLLDGLLHWLTGRPRPLFGPPNMAELTIIVDHKGRGYIFHDRAIEDDPTTLATVASAVIRTAIWFGESHGLRLELGSLKGKIEPPSA